MPGTTDIALCSLTLALLGEDPIESFDDENDNANTCGLVYPALRDAILSEYPWHFATVERHELTRDLATPEAGWKYSFQLPPDRASHGAFALYQDIGISSPPLKQFRISGDRLLANVDRAFLTYTRTATEADFPGYFIQFLSAALAARIAFTVTDDVKLVQHWQSVAFGTPSLDGEGGLKQTAKEIDSQSQPNDAIEDAESFDLIAARMS